MDTSSLGRKGASTKPGHLHTVEEMRVALLECKDSYNRGWLCERHGYQTPAQVRARLLERAA